ncbi:MAG TPA: adenylate/guanylate cyclase domain-containing protein [Roseovarius sp.]|nr:adenylate/guanylate cyclase domain-containing protein [Roseovarius sp.]
MAKQRPPGAAQGMGRGEAMLGAMLRRIGPGRLAGVALLAVILVLRVADPPTVSGLRNAAFDFYQQVKPREPSPVPVTILDIDDPSIEEFGQWPWPRNRVAEMVSKTAAAGAVAIAFDIVFAEPDRLSPDEVARDNPALPEEVRARLRTLPDNDALLAHAMRQTRVVLGQTSVRSARSNRTDKVAMRAVPHAIMGADPTPFLPRFPDVVRNLDILEEAAAGRGVFSVRPDPDGIYRRVPMVMLVQDTLRLGLSPELLRVATGGNAFALRSNEAGIDGVVLGGKMIRTGPDGSVWTYLTPSLPGRYVSAGDVLADRVVPGRLAGQLVLVGTSAIGLEDFRPTPLGVPMAGVEIHAQLLENILTDALLNRPNYAVAVELMTVLVLSALVIILVPVIGARLIIALAVVLLGGYSGLSYYLFQEMRILLDPTWPVLGTVLTLMLMSSANYLREERQKQQIRGAFGQYVSPDLVARLQENPEALTLGGERRELTVLFSDVRGFTTLAEGYRDDPPGLTALMNSFLTVLSRAILREGGTIDKFMGDAVMAFWNAPLDAPDHAAAACRAALAMHADVATLNAERARTAAEANDKVLPINVGIGLNTGDCVVGNMGSDTRFDYTALGDAVNLASRLEGQSKTYGLGIILGSATARAVEGRFAMIELDLLRVKGKMEPERIFGLLGDEVMLGRSEFAELEATNAEMRAAYSAQEWNVAEAALDRLEAAGKPLDLELSGYAMLYRKRLETLRAAPPGEGWNGVHVATDK